jgi:hypothetical protein
MRSTRRRNSSKNSRAKTSYINKSKWINSTDRHNELDGAENKEHETYSIANRITTMVNSALGKNTSAIDAMTNEKIDDIKRLYDNDKKKQLEEIKLLIESNKKILEDIQKLKTEKANPPPINPTNYQMVVVDKKETKEESKEKEKTTIEKKKNEIPKTNQLKEEEEKYNDIRDYFSKVQKSILKDKKDDEQTKTFLKGELSEILEILEEMDSDENNSFLKYDPVYGWVG